MEQSVFEKEICEKAKEWIDEYGEDFLVEIVEVYLEDTPNRLAQLRQAFASGDTETVIREAHTMKSSSANVGAMGLSGMAKEIEFAGRNGKLDDMAAKVERIEQTYSVVKSALESLRAAPAQFINQER